MPESTNAQQVSAFSDNVYEWMRVSRRGLYAFDWSRELSAYQLISIPECPLTESSIRAELLPLFGKVQLDCDFSKRTGNEQILVFS